MIIAHRGFRTKKGENRMIDFKKSLLFTKGIEFDIRLTKDKQVIIFHDTDFKRIGGIKAKVKELDYDEIKKIPFFANNIENVPPLFIEDFCKSLAHKFELINVEIKWDNYSKSDYEILSKALDQLRAHTKAEIIISSFHHEDLIFIAGLDKNKFEKGYLIKNTETFDFKLVQNFNYLHPSIRFLKNKKNLEFINKVNLDLNVWTFKSKSEVYTLYKLYGDKISNYISDTPNLNLEDNSEEDN